MNLVGLQRKDLKWLSHLYAPWADEYKRNIQSLINWMVENDVDTVEGWYDIYEGAYIENVSELNDTESFDDWYPPTVARWFMEIVAVSENGTDRQPSGEFTIADLERMKLLCDATLTLTLPEGIG